MKKAMLLFVSLFLSAGVHAASWDFAAEAFGMERGVEGDSFTEGGIELTATSSADAYLDDISGGKPAGLGVCSDGLTATLQCVKAGGDNITGAEELTLSFDEAVVIGDVQFRDAGHNQIFNGGSVLVTNLTTAMSQSFVLAAIIDLSSLGFGEMFSFMVDGAGPDDQFYIQTLNAEVPVPAALFLFAPAVLGFLGLRRKSTQAV